MSILDAIDARISIFEQNEDSLDKILEVLGTDWVHHMNPKYFIRNHITELIEFLTEHFSAKKSQNFHMKYQKDIVVDYSVSQNEPKVS